MTRSIYPVLARQTTLPFYLAGIGISDPEYHAVRENGLTSHQFLFTEKGKGLLKIGGETTRNNAAVLFILRQKLRMSIIHRAMNGARAGWFFAENMQTSLCLKWDFQVSIKQTNLICRDL